MADEEIDRHDPQDTEEVSESGFDEVAPADGGSPQSGEAAAEADADEPSASVAAEQAGEGKQDSHAGGLNEPDDGAGDENPDTNAESVGKNSTDALLDRAEADLAAAVAGDLDAGETANPDLSSAQPLEFETFENTLDDAEGRGLDALEDVELDLRIELGRAELLVEDVLRLKEGSVVPLDKLAGDPVDILVNGRLVARGEVLVLNDNFCVRVAEILVPDL